MDYTTFIKEYAKKNGFKFTIMNEDTCKINSRDGLLKVYFRDYKTYLGGWGAIIEYDKNLSLEELEKYLDNEFRTKKEIFCLDENYEFVKSYVAEIDEKINKEYFDERVKYLLVCDFYNPSKLYEYKDGIKEIPLPKIENPIEKLKEIFKNKNIDYRIDKIYLGYLERGSESLVVDENKETYLVITSSLFGLGLYVNRRSKTFDLSKHKSIRVDLTKQKLEDVDFFSLFE